MRRKIWCKLAIHGGKYLLSSSISSRLISNDGDCPPRRTAQSSSNCRKRSSSSLKITLRRSLDLDKVSTSHFTKWSHTSSNRARQSAQGTTALPWNSSTLRAATRVSGNVNGRVSFDLLHSPEWLSENACSALSFRVSDTCQINVRRLLSFPRKLSYEAKTLPLALLLDTDHYIRQKYERDSHHT